MKPSQLHIPLSSGSFSLTCSCVLLKTDTMTHTLIHNIPLFPSEDDVTGVESRLFDSLDEMFFIL